MAKPKPKVTLRHNPNKPETSSPANPATSERPAAPKAGIFAGLRSAQQNADKEIKALEKKLERFQSQLRHFKKSSEKILGDKSPENLEDYPKALEEKFQRLERSSRNDITITRLFDIYGRLPPTNGIDEGGMKRFMLNLEGTIRNVGKDLIPLNEVIFDDNFAPSLELQKHLARITLSKVYSLEKIQYAVRLTPRQTEYDEDMVTTGVLTSIVLEWVMEDSFPISEWEEGWKYLMDEKIKPEVKSPFVMRCLAILNRRIGLHLLEDPNRPTNHIIDRAKQLVQRLEALMQPLIQKSSQEVLVQFRNHMEKAFTLAIRTYVALRLNVSKCEYYWPKDIDERFIGLDPSETNMKPWLVTSPTITARLPEWENSKIDFRIPAEYCYYDENSPSAQPVDWQVFEGAKDLDSALNTNKIDDKAEIPQNMTKQVTRGRSMNEDNVKKVGDMKTSQRKRDSSSLAQDSDVQEHKSKKPRGAFTTRDERKPGKVKNPQQEKHSEPILSTDRIVHEKKRPRTRSMQFAGTSSKTEMYDESMSHTEIPQKRKRNNSDSALESSLDRKVVGHDSKRARSEDYQAVTIDSSDEELERAKISRKRNRDKKGSNLSYFEENGAKKVHTKARVTDDSDSEYFECIEETQPGGNMASSTKKASSDAKTVADSEEEGSSMSDNYSLQINMTNSKTNIKVNNASRSIKVNSREDANRRSDLGNPITAALNSGSRSHNLRIVSNTTSYAEEESEDELSLHIKLKAVKGKENSRNGQIGGKVSVPELEVIRKVCINCQMESKRLTRERCHNCYDYWKRRNEETERPEALWKKAMKKTKLVTKSIKTASEASASHSTESLSAGSSTLPAAPSATTRSRKLERKGSLGSDTESQDDDVEDEDYQSLPAKSKTNTKKGDAQARGSDSLKQSRKAPARKTKIKDDDEYVPWETE